MRGFRIFAALGLMTALVGCAPAYYGGPGYVAPAYGYGGYGYARPAYGYGYVAPAPRFYAPAPVYRGWGGGGGWGGGYRGGYVGGGYRGGYGGRGWRR